MIDWTGDRIKRQTACLLGNMSVNHMTPINSIKRQAGVAKKLLPGEEFTDMLCKMDKMLDISLDEYDGPYVEGGFMGMDPDLKAYLENYLGVDVDKYQRDMDDACEYAEEYPEDVVNRKVKLVLMKFTLKVIGKWHMKHWGW